MNIYESLPFDEALVASWEEEGLLQVITTLPLWGKFLLAVLFPLMKRHTPGCAEELSQHFMNPATRPQWGREARGVIAALNELQSIGK